MKRRSFRDIQKGLHQDFTSDSDLKIKVAKYLTSTAQKLMKSMPLETHKSSSRETHPETEVPHARKDFENAMNEALMANADGYWFSIVCDYGDGYAPFVSPDKDFITSWGLQLAHRFLGTSSAYSAPVGSDFVRVTVPRDDVHPMNFSCLFKNNGVAKVQWRGDGEAISLVWLLVRGIVTLQELVGHSLVRSREPIQIGFSISNAPQKGIETSRVFKSQSTRTNFQLMQSYWTSSYGEPVDVDKFIRLFLYKTLSEWGYKYFEESVNHMQISNSLQALVALDSNSISLR